MLKGLGGGKALGISFIGRVYQSENKNSVGEN